MDNLSDIRQYLALFRRWLWLIVLVPILAGGAAYLISRQIHPIYQSTTRILINQAPAYQSTDYTSILTSERLARTYAEMITSQPILEEVIKSLQLSTDTTKLFKLVDVALVRDTQLIDVSVKDPNPVRAAAIANELVKVFVEQTQNTEASRYAASKQNLEKQIAELDQRIQDTNVAIGSLGAASQNQTERDRLEANLAQYQQTYSNLLQSYEQVRVAEAQSTSNLVLVQPAAPGEKPISPKVLLNTLLAALIGMMLAVGVVFLAEYLDDTLKTPEDIARVLELPVIGYIAEMNAHQDEIYVAAVPRSPVSEAFRLLRTNIDFAGAAQPMKTILVTSAGPSEGKSTVALNLATVMAQNGKRVTLVDADMRRPRIHKFLRLNNRVGLSHVFLGTSPIEAALQNVPVKNLRIMTSGSIPPNPAELMGSERMVQILENLETFSDVVILDSPPFVVSDAAVLATHVDGVVLVVKPGFTYRDAAVSMLEQLNRAGARILGVVLNQIPRNRGYYYGGYRHYSPYNNRYQTGYQAYYDADADQNPAGRSRKSLQSIFTKRANHHNPVETDIPEITAPRSSSDKGVEEWAGEPDN